MTEINHEKINYDSSYVQISYNDNSLVCFLPITDLFNIWNHYISISSTAPHKNHNA